MRGARRRRGWIGPAGIALTLAVALAYLLVRDAAPFAALEGQTLDARFALRGPIAPAADTVLLAIDDKTVRSAGSWPIPRTLLADALDRLVEDGASVLALDVLLFDGGSRPGGARSDVALRADPDLRLAAALERATEAVLAAAFQFGGGQGEFELAADLDLSTVAIVRRPPSAALTALPQPSDIAAPPAELVAVATAGHANVFLEPDGRLRFAHAALGVGDRLLPFLPVEAVRLHAGIGRSGLVFEAGRSIEIGPLQVPIDRAGRFPIDFLGPPGTFERHSVIDLVEGRVPAGTFTDRVVVIGADAIGAHDRFATSYSPALSGMELFANVVDNLLTGRTLRRDGLVAAIDVAAILLGGFLALQIRRARSAGVALVLLLGLLTAWAGLAQMAFTLWHLWLSVTFPLAAMLAVGIMELAARFQVESRGRIEAEAGRAHLARYVSPLLGRYDAGSEGGEARRENAIVLFVDMQGFTGLGEHLTPDAAMALLRRFHRQIERTVLAHGGVVDKFLGDGAMCLFGLPDPGPQDARDALRCARELAAGEGAKVGIGLHMGPVILGEVGGEQAAQVTVIGDTVNVASRLEALTRALGATVLVSDAVVEAARADGDGHEELADLRALEPMALRGRSEPMRVWALGGDENAETHPAPLFRSGRGTTA